MAGPSSELFYTCAILTKFYPPLVNKSRAQYSMYIVYKTNAVTS